MVVLHRQRCPTPPESLRKYTEMYVLHEERVGLVTAEKMPKSKGKKSSKRHKSKEQCHSGSGIPVPEDLPQVWLPVQTEERGYFSNERKVCQY